MIIKDKDGKEIGEVKIHYPAAKRPYDAREFDVEFDTPYGLLKLNHYSGAMLNGKRLPCWESGVAHSFRPNSLHDDMLQNESASVAEEAMRDIWKLDIAMILDVKRVLLCKIDEMEGRAAWFVQKYEEVMKSSMVGDIHGQ
jgi:hypothetical protein